MATFNSDGSQGNVQTLVNGAATGDIITIPSGTFSWTGTLTINKGVTLQGTGKTTSTIQNNNATSGMLAATSDGDGHITLSNFGIQQVANNGGANGRQALVLDRNDATIYTVLIHDCKFDSNAIFNYMVFCAANGFVFWNCDFIGSGVNGLGGISMVCSKYGAGTSGSPYGWNTASTMGALDTTGLRNTYIEDCTLSNAPTGGTNADDNARMVFRYCTVTDAVVANHGQDTSQYGMRHDEIYNCTFHNVNGSTLNVGGWMSCRGGTFAWHDNVIEAPPSGKASYNLICQQINRAGGPGSCQTAHPANRQAGRGWSSGSSSTSGNPVVAANGTGETSDPGYIWNNTGAGSGLSFVGIDQYSPDDCGNGQLDTLTFTCNITNGSNQITNVTITTNAGFAVPPSVANNLDVTMGIYDSTGNFFAQGTTITGIAGTTLTLSNSALSGGTGVSLKSGYITLGTDVIFGTPKPGYTPYTYPHPLRAGGTPFIQAVLRVSLVVH